MEYNTGILPQKTYTFALRIVKAYKYLYYEKVEYVLSKQLLRSGTSIGANCHEAIYAQSSTDFISKLSISLKEASETSYWLELLHDSEYFTDESYISIKEDCVEIIKLLTSIINTSKKRLSIKTPSSISN